MTMSPSAAGSTPDRSTTAWSTGASRSSVVVLLNAFFWGGWEGGGRGGVV